MPLWPKRWHFDRADHDLVAALDAIVAAGSAGKGKHLQRLIDPYLHPRGIKELAAPREIRLVYAMHRLLALGHAPEAAEQRIQALRALRQEVIEGSDSPLRLNAARLLLQLMKLLVRSAGQPHERRLRLAHDLRETLVGQPRFIRRQLARHHLLEMPEAWNQATFDDHVYDANTKGRKTPTHLIMDAWIKGIRRLQVVYYGRIPPAAAQEILAAGGIMDIDIRIGVEFTVVGDGQPVKLVWTPRGFASSGQFLEFLEQAPVRDFFAAYADAEQWSRAQVLSRLARFNETARAGLNRRLALDLPPLTEKSFLESVGFGQPSSLHLAEFIHAAYADRLDAAPATKDKDIDKDKGNRDNKDKSGDNDEDKGKEDKGEAVDFAAVGRERERLSPETIHDEFFDDASELAEMAAAARSADCPAALRLTAAELTRRLHALPSGCRICLNLAGLGLADVVYLVLSADGLITHMELFNLKEFKTAPAADLVAINTFRQALNHGDVVRIKHTLKTLLAGIEATATNPETNPETISAATDAETSETIRTTGTTETNAADERPAERAARLRNWLGDLPRLAALYAAAPLDVRIGSHSTGRHRRLRGMGMAAVDSLPGPARRRIRAGRDPYRELVPLEVRLVRTVRYAPPSRGRGTWWTKLAGRLGHPFGLGTTARSSWLMEDISVNAGGGQPGNIATLGGYWDDPSHAADAPAGDGIGGGGDGARDGWATLNYRVQIAVKILAGFLPAFLTFYFTQSWWLLAYGGAAIWLGITAVRNVLQSVLGGGGWRRSELLRWKNFVSWRRVADSLLYTGLSVPLLELGVRYFFLGKVCGLDAADAPARVYSVLALVNGGYLAWHNRLRGLPRAAIFGNFFRAVVSIPLAIAASDGLLLVLGAAGVAGAGAIVTQWTSIISKITSDAVAALVEGYADRRRHIRMRMRDYRAKFRQLFAHYSRLETLFPEEDVLERLKSPKSFVKSMSREGGTLARGLIINALDLMYFWFYQPQAPRAWGRIVRGLTDEERAILLRSQTVLKKEKEVGQLFIDGLVGKNFSAALSFYLGRNTGYLREIKAATPPPATDGAAPTGNAKS